MRCRPIALGILLTMALVTMPVSARVTVAFVNPNSFTDIGDFEQDPAQTLSEIEQYLKGLGDRYLSPQTTLRIEVLDISLAGRLRWPSRTNWVVRVMTGEADWPRVELRYTLESDGMTSRSADETVVDMFYLRRLEWQYLLVTLPYEKRMLDGWFRARFVEPSREKPGLRGVVNSESQERTNSQKVM